MATKVETTVEPDQLVRSVADGLARAGAHANAELLARMEAVTLEMERQFGIAQLAGQLTTGTDRTPRGLKGVDADLLKTHLLALLAAESQWWGDLLTGIVRDGLAELPRGTRSLPKEYADKLDAGEFKLADLSNPVLALGDLAQYDLGQWQGQQ